MPRTDHTTVAELMAQLAANAVEIAALKADKEALSQRVFKLEEELALARLHRFAPRSEKRVDRVFNEAEQIGVEDEAVSCDSDTICQIQDCQRLKSSKAKSVGANRYRKTCHASASSMTFLRIRKAARAAASECIAWAKPSPSSFILR